MEHVEKSKSQNSPGQDMRKSQWWQMRGPPPTQTSHEALQKACAIGAHTSVGIDRANVALSRKMNALADVLRRNAAQGGSVGSAPHSVVNRLSADGSYLEEHTFMDMSKEATSLIQRYPVQAPLVGFGVGYLISRGLEQ